MTIRVILADDHTLVRAGLKNLLDSLDGVQVVAETGTGAEVPALVAEHSPDVVLMDIEMPGMTGLEATEVLKAEAPDTSVIILSMHDYEEFVLKALQVGASGYLVKEAATSELEIALRAVGQGQTYLSPRVSRQIISQYLGRSGETTAAGSSLPSTSGPLTDRQREVLRLIAMGRSTREIAEQLHLSVKTVESHRANIMDRLEIRDVPGLVRYAVRERLVSD